MNPLFHELFQKTRYLTNEINYTLKKHNLYASQWSVLFCIKKHGEMSLTQIWKYLNVEAPTITRTVYRLVELGWVDIYPGKDRREKIVKLSEKALLVFPEIKASIVEFEERTVSNLTPEEQILLIQLLQKMK
ncbi:MarR family transcriptional regulator [Bacillus sp. FJAT-22090]|uniref:MarR family winged helix-turn-helix transcriptional regulator n=1 Tax=Bacillus sp. FJAT-22090 TaxID=1581038 RepID=UPI0006B05863|nr:MarR family transcriptional regulator [Bacillus sp. FJAT-22090]ALC87256.1 MarR family transcriptional regulator [Bacillus sp. FJAT-22090]